MEIVESVKNTEGRRERVICREAEREGRCRNNNGWKEPCEERERERGGGGEERVDRSGSRGFREETASKEENQRLRRDRYNSE